jgi:hypothetical protein
MTIDLRWYPSRRGKEEVGSGGWTTTDEKGNLPVTLLFCRVMELLITDFIFATNFACGPLDS